MRTIALAFLLAALAGCAANPTRESALLLVDQIDEYEKAIDAKVAAEQTYYAATRRDLQDQARRQAELEQELDYLAGVTDLTDQATVRDRGLQVSVLQAFLRGLNEAGRNAEEQRSQREAELRAIYQVNFKALSVDSREKATNEQFLRFLQESAQRAIELNEQEQDGGGN
jgi:hypothetical protein